MGEESRVVQMLPSVDILLKMLLLCLNIFDFLIFNEGIKAEHNNMDISGSE